MKNMIKMSLVAAVAVAGLSSTVAAKPLEEAIKNVDVSGTIVYRFEDYSDDKKTGTHANNYKIATSIKSKVNDTITATVRVLAASADGNFVNLPSNASSTSNTPDSNVATSISQASFTAKLGASTVIVGKQGLATPWTKAIDSDGNEQTGTGALALVPVGPVTLAAGAFNQTNITTGGGNGDEDLIVAAAMAKVGPVALDAWYLDIDKVFTTYTVGAKATVEGITIDARHANLELEGATTDNTLTFIKASAKIGDIGVWANYATTGKDGGTTAVQSTAKTSVIGWKVLTNGKADADMIMVGAKMDVMSGLNVALNYNTIDYKSGTTDMEQTEIYTQITHSMGKNFSTYLRYGTFEEETGSATTSDSLRARLQVEYKF